MRTLSGFLGAMILAAAMSSAVVAPAAAADAPTNGCRLVLPASHQDDGSGARRTTSIAVDHPASVRLASDCTGSPLSVADVLVFFTAGPNTIGGGMAQN